MITIRPPALLLRPYERVAQHVLLPFADDVRAADVRASERLSHSICESILDDVPDSWLEEGYPR